MLSPPFGEPKKIPQQFVLHLQTPDFILLFLLYQHVSLWRSFSAAGHDSRFHFSHSPVIPFDPSLYYVFVLTKYSTISRFVFPVTFISSIFFYRLYISCHTKSPPVVVIFLRQRAFRQCPFFLVLCKEKMEAFFICCRINVAGADVLKNFCFMEPPTD